MKIVFEKIKAWFSVAKSTAEGQITGLEAQFSQSSSGNLPLDLFRCLTDAIQNLPSPATYQTTVQTQLTDALTRWQEQDEAPNYLVILADPVECLPLILQETLANWQHPVVESVCFLWQESARPHELNLIVHDVLTRIEQVTQKSEQSVEPVTRDGMMRSRLSTKLLIVPCLEHCFLRCADGLDGIEQLRNIIVQDRSQFWLIGCNFWAWDYLDYVCHMGAYLEQTLYLPDLNSLQIKQWLTDVMSLIPLENTEEFSQGYRQQSANEEAQDKELENWNSKAEKRYFDSLADTASGISQVAAQLWLRSLYCETAQSNNDNSPSTPRQGNLERTVKCRNPSRPSLPTLTADDRYLLISILLHGSISLPHLALTLAEDQDKAQAQVQTLKRTGLIELHQELLTINPAYYLGLKADLERNNFLVGRDLG